MRISNTWNIGNVLVYLGGVQFAGALPLHARTATTKALNDLLPEYDFIVVGGGTTGLTIANRLTETGNYTVLVVEYGYLDDNPTILATGGDRDDLDPKDVARATATQSYNITTLPIEGLADQKVAVMAAAVVGGSSAINGMMLDRGSAEDYDAWVTQTGSNNSEEFGKEWGWEHLYPWFKKSATFHPPSPELAAEYKITYDTSAWGNSTPLHAGYSPFYWKMQKAMFDSFKEVPGVSFPKEGADGNATGVFWAPATINPADRHRSYARTAHYDPVISRPNYHLLAGWRVTQVTLKSENNADEWTATGVLVTPRDGDMPEGGPVNLKGKREIIISAGSIHTPQVLQRSGIGPREVIEDANGTVRVELPGVGSNLQDHMHFPVFYDWKTPIFPDPSNLTTNLTYAAEAKALWQTNKTGPKSSHTDTVAFLPYQIFTSKVITDATVSKILAQVQNPGAYLPPNTHPTILAGYSEQLKVIAQQFASMSSAVFEIPFGRSSEFYAILVKPLSRGRVILDPKDDGTSPLGRGSVEPLVDYRTRSNPIDIEITASMLAWMRWWMKTPAMENTFHPHERRPGLNITTDADIQRYIAEAGQPGNGHSSGTARIGPQELGGVLGPDLRVHGVQRLSVADCSVMPIIVASHTSSTAYAVGEKAANMILQRARTQTL